MDFADSKLLSAKAYNAEGLEVSIKVERLEKNSYGTPIKISDLPADDGYIVLETKVSPDIPGMIWLSESQTTSGSASMMFSSEPLASMSFFPTQVSPSVLINFTADVKIDGSNTENMLALLSSHQNPKAANPEKFYRFDSPVRLPSYLFSIAVGN